MSMLRSLRDRYAVSSDPLRSERRVELAVVVVALILVLQVLWGMAGAISYEGPAAIAPASDSLSVAGVNSLPAATEEQSREMVARPLFWQDRKPRAAATESAVEESAVAKQATLKGVRVVGVFGSGEAGGAIVVVDGKKRRVLVEEQVSGWTLESVSPQGAVFTKAGARDEKQLTRAQPTATASRAVAEPPPSGQVAAGGPRRATIADLNSAAKRNQTGDYKK